jgi:DNA polymerase III epsilon subunit-like protein
LTRVAGGDSLGPGTGGTGRIAAHLPALVETTAVPKFLLFDCETTGLPRTRRFSAEDVSGWPRLVQLAWGLYDSHGKAERTGCRIVRPEGFRIPAEAAAIHGITHARASRTGSELAEVLDEFEEAAGSGEIILVAHNLDYDWGVVAGEFVRTERPLELLERPGICTMKTTTSVCALPRPGGYGFKWPTLEELHFCLFGRSYEGAHDAARDLEACARCFFKLVEGGHYPPGV